MADTELNISPDEKVAGVPLARLLRNLGETSYNEGAVDLACRLTDCKAVIEELLRCRATQPSPSTAPEVRDGAVFEAAARIAASYGSGRPIVERRPNDRILGRWEGEQAASANIARMLLERAALASRPAEVDDEGLPALPPEAARAMKGEAYFFVKWQDAGKDLRGALMPYTAEQYRQGQRDAVAADRGRRGGGWLPFDTAPRDGSNFLATNGAIVTACRYIDDPGYVREVRDMQGRYLDQVEYEGFEGFMDDEGGLPDLTHWMPYPAAPSHTTNKEK